MPEILGPTSGAHYIDRASAIADATGKWFSTDDFEVVTATVQLEVGAGNVTGTLYCDFTACGDGASPGADPRGYSQVLIPAGALLALPTGVTLPDPAVGVAVAAATSCAFTVSFSQPPAGKMRFRWDWASGTGASPNFISVFVNVAQRAQ